jgi:hypothetical protein
MSPVLLDGAHVLRSTRQKPKPRFVWADPEADGGGGGGGGGGSVGRPRPKPVWTPASAEPNGVSTPSVVPPDAEAVGAGSTGGGGSCGPLTSNPKSPAPEPSGPDGSASALPIPASEKASAAATTPVIFKDTRTVDSDKNMFPLVVVGLAGAAVTGYQDHSPGASRQGRRAPSETAGADNGWRKPRSTAVSRTQVPQEKNARLIRRGCPKRRGIGSHPTTVEHNLRPSRGGIRRVSSRRSSQGEYGQAKRHSDQCHGAHGAGMRRALLCHVPIGQSCLEGLTSWWHPALDCSMPDSG